MMDMYENFHTNAANTNLQNVIISFCILINTETVNKQEQR